MRNSALDEGETVSSPTGAVMAGTVVGLIVGGHVLVVVAQRGPAIMVAVMAVCIAAGAVLGLLVGRMWLDGRRQTARRRAEMRRLRDELEGKYHADLAAAEARYLQEVASVRAHNGEIIRRLTTEFDEINARYQDLLERAGAERVEMERRHDRQAQAHLAAIERAYAYLSEAERLARQHERVIMEQVADIQIANLQERHEMEVARLRGAAESAYLRGRNESRNMAQSAIEAVVERMDASHKAEVRDLYWRVYTDVLRDLSGIAPEQ